jgi:hypothetical protein
MNKRIITAAFAMMLGIVGLVGSASAGPMPRGKWDQDTLGGGRVMTYTVTCYGGENTTFRVNGNGNSDLDIYVYDTKGNLIASDESRSDQCELTFLAYRTVPFVFKIVNRGNWSNNFYATID